MDSRIDELRRRLERDPGSRLFAQLAEEYRKAGNQAEAIRVARAGLSHHPSYPSARVTLGRALLEAGDLSGAKTELESALREAPDNILASRFLGQALEAQGDFGGALERYRATLRMAPGDRLLESQIRALGQRLGAPGTVGTGAPAGPYEVTRAMPRAEPPVESGGGEEGPFAPTIRIRMQPERGAPTLLPPEPPPLPAGPRRLQRSEAGTGETVPPATTPEPELQGVPLATEGTPESPSEPVPEGEAAPLSVEPFYESDVAPTLPTAQAPEFARPSPGEAAQSTQEAAGILEAEPAEAEPATVEAVEATVLEAEAPEAPAAPVRVEGEPEAEEAPAATPFSSSTLAELYFRQGLVERAVEVYRQVIAAEPENEKARARLEQLTAPAEPAASGGPATGADQERAARRRALERTITRLEALLTVVRRR